MSDLYIGFSMVKMANNYCNDNNITDKAMRKAMRNAFIAGATKGFERCVDFIELVTWIDPEEDSVINSDVITDSLYEDQEKILKGKIKEENKIDEQKEYYENL